MSGDSEAYRNYMGIERQRAKLLRLHAQGLNDYEIADALGVTQSGVLYLRRRHRIPANTTRGAQPGIRNVTVRRVRDGTWCDPAKRADVQEKLSRSRRGAANPSYKHGRAVGKSGRGRRVAEREGINLSECSRCGSGRNIVVHHRNRDGLDNRPVNLEVLCNSCHQREHRGKRQL